MKKSTIVLICSFTIMILIYGLDLYFIMGGKKQEKIEKNSDPIYTINYIDVNNNEERYIIEFDNNYDTTVIKNVNHKESNNKISYSDEKKVYVKNMIKHLKEKYGNEDFELRSFEGMYYDDILILKSIIDNDESILNDIIENDFKLSKSNDCIESLEPLIINNQEICTLSCEMKDSVNIEFENGETSSLTEVLEKNLLQIEQLNTAGLGCY